LGAEALHAPARVLVGLRAAQTVVDVQRGDIEAELAKRMEQARRVRTAGDEAQHIATGLDQVVPADVRFDPAQKLQILSVPAP
ncbi:MAG TPA: hypothetical protein VGO39_05505, partial [Gaiellaceae bacterium]|nr:hypothetical protein [Gaiellaceae bacterium]